MAGKQTPQRPSMQPSESPAEPLPKLSVAKRTGGSRTSTDAQRLPSAPASRLLSPDSSGPKRRVSAGTATDPVPIDDDEPTPSPNLSKRAVQGDLDTPTRAPRTRRTVTEPSNETAGLPTPPSMPPKSKSSPEVPRRPRSKPSETKELSPFELDRAIADKLRKIEGRRDKKGFNYVASVVNEQNAATGLTKIGITVVTVTGRLSTQEYRCDREFKEKLVPNQRRLRDPHHRRVEKLVMTELQNSQHVFYCEACKTNHREYFMVSADLAAEVTQRWISLCQKEPWDETGRLYPFWEERLDSWQMCCDEEHDDEQRAERWRVFIEASWWEQTRFSVISSFEKLWPRRWQFVCFFQALWMVYITFPNASISMIAWGLQFALLFDKHFNGPPSIPSMASRAQRRTSPAKKASSVSETTPARKRPGEKDKEQDVFSPGDEDDVEMVDQDDEYDEEPSFM